jgi:hypothetical protein
VANKRGGVGAMSGVLGRASAGVVYGSAGESCRFGELIIEDPFTGANRFAATAALLLLRANVGLGEATEDGADEDDA